MARAETFLAGWRAYGPAPSAVSAAQNELATQAFWCLLASSAPNDALSAPRNLACRTLENRSLLLREYIHHLTWQAPMTGSATAYRVYDASSGSRVLLAELAPGGQSYLRRRVERAGAYIYAVLAVDGSGAEGSPACVEPGPAPAVRKTVRTSAQGLDAISQFAQALRRLAFARPL